MVHHKRHKPKNARAGCLFCKPQKAIGADRRTIQEMSLAQQIVDRVWTERD